MIFECRVFDKNGNLARVHSAKELEARADKICQALLPEKDREFIRDYKEVRRTPYSSSFGEELWQ